MTLAACGDVPQGPESPTFSSAVAAGSLETAQLSLKVVCEPPDGFGDPDVTPRRTPPPKPDLPPPFSPNGDKGRAKATTLRLNLRCEGESYPASGLSFRDGVAFEISAWLDPSLKDEGTSSERTQCLFALLAPQASEASRDAQEEARLLPLYQGPVLNPTLTRLFRRKVAGWAADPLAPLEQALSQRLSSPSRGEEVAEYLCIPQ